MPSQFFLIVLDCLSNNAITTHQHHSIYCLFFPQDTHQIIDTKNTLSRSSLGKIDIIVCPGCFSFTPNKFLYSGYRPYRYADIYFLLSGVLEPAYLLAPLSPTLLSEVSCWSLKLPDVAVVMRGNPPQSCCFCFSSSSCLPGDPTIKPLAEHHCLQH